MTTIGTHMTTIGRDEETNAISVRYHRTNVVQFNGSTVTLDHGEWLTQTTKRRMNQASEQFNLGFHVYQKDNVWFVSTKSGTVLPWWTDRTITFDIND
tara:strand:+ start:76 stop:369 length:294 start_codon:yes stop_codon:yes gene_type:complete